jgi:hypothetical protein
VKPLYFTGLLALIVSGLPTDGNTASDGHLARAVQNPVSDLISLPFQNNINFNVGPEEKTQNILNIQPVWPVSLNDEWKLITRTILPVISQPGFAPGDGRTNGIGDTTFTAFLSPKKPSNGLIWGAGPVVLLPTASDDDLGSDKWGVGPSAVFLTMKGPWVIGSLFSNVWSVGGSGDQNVNLFTWQYFINYNLPNGAYITSAPINTANWEADSGEKWTVPLGGGVGKIFRVGKQSMNAQASAYYNVEKPKYAADWQLRLQLQFLFPR